MCTCRGFGQNGKQMRNKNTRSYVKASLQPLTCVVSRFQRYRGLKSFRSSPWDPMENLPLNYSRIFQFQSFDRTRRRILTEAAEDEEGAMVKQNKSLQKRMMVLLWNTIIDLCDSVPGGLVCYAAHHRCAVVSDGECAVWEALDRGVSPASWAEGTTRDEGVPFRFLRFSVNSLTVCFCCLLFVARCRWCTYWWGDIPATQSPSSPKRSWCFTAASGASGPRPSSLSTHQVVDTAKKNNPKKQKKPNWSFKQQTTTLSNYWACYYHVVRVINQQNSSVCKCHSWHFSGFDCPNHFSPPHFMQQHQRIHLVFIHHLFLEIL